MWKNWHSNNFEKQKVEKPMSQIPYILAAIDVLLMEWNSITPKIELIEIIPYA